MRKKKQLLQGGSGVPTPTTVAAQWGAACASAGGKNVFFYKIDINVWN